MAYSDFVAPYTLKLKRSSEDLLEQTLLQAARNGSQFKYRSYWRPSCWRSANQESTIYRMTAADVANNEDRSEFNRQINLSSARS